MISFCHKILTLSHLKLFETNLWISSLLCIQYITDIYTMTLSSLLFVARKEVETLLKDITTWKVTLYQRYFVFYCFTLKKNDLHKRAKMKN